MGRGDDGAVYCRGKTSDVLAIAVVINFDPSSAERKTEQRSHYHL